MGKYGIDRNTVEEIIEEDCDKMMVETPKIIEAKQDAREAATAFYGRAWVYAERGAPEFAGAYYNRGFSQQKMNQFDKALDDFMNTLRFYLKNDGSADEIENSKLW
jgi:tetratricopeptide (TPR) repeat protein